MLRRMLREHSVSTHPASLTGLLGSCPPIYIVPIVPKKLKGKKIKVTYYYERMTEQANLPKPLILLFYFLTEVTSFNIFSFYSLQQLHTLMLLSGSS